jgi:c-di-GMP-binding flagellar brake protein YcgR
MFVFGRNNSNVLGTTWTDGLVEINEHVVLEFGGETFSTIVEDIRDGRVYVSVPEDRNGHFPIRPGDRMAVSVRGSEDRTVFSAEAIDIVEENILLMVLGDFRYVGADERRAAPRLNMRMAFWYRHIGADEGMGFWHSAETEDISSSGCAFTAKHSYIVRVGDELELEMKTPGGDIFHATCRVVAVRHRKQKRDAQIVIGAVFTAIPEDAQKQIAKYVEHQLQDAIRTA